MNPDEEFPTGESKNSDVRCRVEYLPSALLKNQLVRVPPVLFQYQPSFPPSDTPLCLSTFSATLRVLQIKSTKGTKTQGIILCFVPFVAKKSKELAIEKRLIV